jgi:2',3'-cyclic-nucleotide 2'-phosphodiesterase (5'-nucleotidase family)
VYPAGPLTRRNVIDMHPFGGVVCKVAIPGRLVLEALENGVAKMPASAGQFPQVSGLTMRVEPRAPPGARIREVRVGGTPIEADHVYTVAITDYMLRGGDGYAMFDGQPVLVSPESGPLIATVLEEAIAAEGEIDPAVDGRIVMEP